jgi:hypothetical protein
LDRSLASVRRAPLLAVFFVAGAIFWRTAYPTITWWDSSSYSLAARTLALTSPPGSVLLTLLGWPVAHLPIGSSPAHSLNLFAGALAALVVALVFIVAFMLRRTAGGDGHAGFAVGAALGASTLAFSDTLWTYATAFTPYILTAVFTALILWTMLRWWNDAEGADGWRWIALLGVLFGLDFSVHRTNALLGPGALAWILIRDWRTLGRLATWLGGIGGLVAGLAVQLLVIPIAAHTTSPLDFVVADTWQRFWDYITLKQLGGGFLLSVFPRKSPLWSAQTMDVLRALGANFFHWNGRVGVLGMLPAVWAILGIVVLWRANRRLAAAWILVILLQFAATVLYFNTPANFFRSFDRHYLPIGVPIAMLIAYGMGVVIERAGTLSPTRRLVAAVMAALAPAAQLIGNWSAHDASRQWFARDFATNVLEALPPNAILFTVGDNDTFPLMYVQGVEGVRRDVAILNLSVANLPEYEQRRHRRDPSFPISMTTPERRALTARDWTDTTLTVPVEGTSAQLGLREGTSAPTAITFNGVRPTTGPRLLASELTVFDIVRTNRWRRPLAFAITGTTSSMMWLAPFGRLDCLFWRVVPQRDPRLEVEQLRERLFNGMQYRGFADPAVRIEGFTRNIGAQYHAAARVLLETERARGDIGRCRLDMRIFESKIPPDRLRLPDEFGQRLASACGALP